MKKLKLQHVFLAVTFVLGLSIIVLLPSVSLAAEKNKMVKVEEENNEVTITVQKKADFYKIYKDEELVYEGPNNIFKEKMDYISQKYKVGIYNNEKLEKVVSLKVSNDFKKETLLDADTHKEDKIGQIIRTTKLQTNVSDKLVELQWPELPDQDGIYEIYRDDQKVGETKELNYTDDSVKPDTEYTYTVKVDNKVSKEK
ncbi:hypothetical protein SAMN05443252_11711, partial [Bacillus sp. OV322]